MMRFFLSLFILLSSVMYAHDAPQIQTFKGTVVSVQKYNLVIRPAPVLQFILKSSGQEFTVEVAPVWYLNEQGLVLVPREEVEVTGYVKNIDNKKIIIASCIKKGSSYFKLRQEDNTPVWSN